MDLTDTRLLLFLSRATPLKRWDEIGILGREIALYKALRPHLAGIGIVSSGGSEELAFQNQLGDIQILYNRWGLSPNSYSLLAPFLHWQAMRKGTVYKTNQLDGAWTAIIASKVHRKPVVVRAGYLWAKHFRGAGGKGVKASVIGRLERFSFQNSTAAILTTEAMKQFVCEKYHLPTEQIAVVPNYVDTTRFRPMLEKDKISGQICYVGRLHPRKNIDLIIEALAHLPEASLVLMGGGTQRVRLEKLAKRYRCHGRVSFLGSIEQNQIPLQMNQSEVFILPSKFEGHPKALIEAMACGMPVVGTDVEGIRNVIQHEETGLLCPPTVESVRLALKRLLSDKTLGARLGEAARAFVKREYSLERILRMELDLIQGIPDQDQPRSKESYGKK